jgi:molybdopterin converting factor small subunit
MPVSVKLFALLRRYRPDLPRGGTLSVELKVGTTVGEMLLQLGIPDGAPVVAMVNGTVRGFDHTLSDGDQLYLFPPVSGG